MVELSVVLITKNQAWNISRLVESVLDAASSVPSEEIILVDSASTDETVDLASRYPISIFRLQARQRLSPAIGRYVGYKRTQGDFVLFLDGDTRLFPGWLPHALRLIRETPNVGAVTGKVINLPTCAAADKNIPSVSQSEATNPPREVLWGSYGGGGAAIYRRSVLEQVGPFNPGLNADEEPELGFRIRRAGYRILELDQPIVRHYNDAPASVSTALDRRRRKFHLGAGQAARYHLRSAQLWPWLRERPWGIGAALIYFLGLGTLLAGLIAGNFIWFEVWLLGFCSLIGYLSFKKRSGREALVAAFNWLILAEGFLKGFFIKPLRVENFHPIVDRVKVFKAQERIAEGDAELGSAQLSTITSEIQNTQAEPAPR